MGPRAQLGNHLAGTEGAEFTAAGQILPLGIGMEKTSCVEIACPGGIYQLPQPHGGDADRLVAAEN